MNLIVLEMSRLRICCICTAFHAFFFFAAPINEAMSFLLTSVKKYQRILRRQPEIELKNIVARSFLWNRCKKTILSQNCAN